MRSRSTSSLVPTIAQSVCATMQTRVTPSRFTARISDRSASSVTRAPALRMIFASPGRSPSMARGSMRESMHVRTASPLAAVPFTPESWNPVRYRTLAASRSSNMDRFYQHGARAGLTDRWFG